MNGLYPVLAVPCLLAAALAATATPVSQPTNSVPGSVVQDLLDRVHSNAVNRLRVDFEIERVRAERDRLEAERARVEADQRRLQGEIDALKQRIATTAPPREAWAPGPFVVLVATTARGPGNTTLELEPLQVLEVTGRTADARYLFRSGPAEYDVPADRVATEAAVRDQLGKREEMLVERLGKARASGEATGDIEAQLARVRLTRETVRQAFARHRAESAGATNAPPAPATAP